jgi:subtilisin family serine protease
MSEQRPTKIMVGYRTISLALLLCALLPGVAQANPATNIIVKRDPGLTAAERADIRADAGVQLVETLNLPRTEVVAAQPGDVADALRDLNADPDVVYAERDQVRTATAPNDPLFFSDLWAIPFIEADAAWSLQEATPTPRDITGLDQWVAVVDSGIDDTHPDLINQIHSQKDFVGGDLVATDGDGHGTHVSGTIAAEGDNNEGVVGVAPGAKIMALRVLDDEGSGYDSDIADAFTFAASQGTKVVNASLGGAAPSATLRTAIHNASGTLFVVAAGNDGDDNDYTPTYPCNTPEPNVLCVGASGYQVDEVAWFSNYGSRAVDVFAPGVWIPSTIPQALAGPGFDEDDEDFGTEPYEYMHGTSMAAPHVSAVAALVLQAAPGLTPKDVKQIILASAESDPELDDSVSGGRVNAYEAVALALAGNVSSLPNQDLDDWIDAADACPAEPFNTSDGCAVDDDWDRAPDATDNCPGVSNPSQGDADHDGAGDSCDADMDNDGIPNSSDLCKKTPGVPAYGGCQPPPTSTAPPSTPTGPADADGDGFTDASDGCPNESAATSNGCPLAQVSSLSARGGKRSATVKVVATRDSQVKITVQRKKGRRWVRVTRKTVFGTKATLRLKRLKRGTHRVRISITSSAGNGSSVSKTFRVR